MTTSDETANFCHDHYEHPLLWCEEKKRLIERKNAEESLRMWRRRKAEEMARKEREKQEYFDLYLKHCPWGRPGGGAPNVDVRRKDITAVGLHSTPTINMPNRLISLQPPCRYSDYFSKHRKCHDPAAIYHHHHHAPRVTTHAHTVHHITDTIRPAIAGSTVTICEREGPGTLTVPSKTKNGERHVDIEVRYKPTIGKGKPMLEKIVVTETDKCPLAPAQQSEATKSPQKKKQSFKMDKAGSKDPWGKPGPGGKPWRSPKAAGSTFMKSMGWTNKEVLKELDQDNPATPAEKNTFRKSRSNKKLQRCCAMCTCTCPAMMSGALKSTHKKPQHSSPTKVEPNPILTGKICPRFMRRCVPDVIPGAVDNSRTTTDNTTSTSNLPGGGVELVPLLARRRAKNRPISLSSTDVTKRTASHDRYAINLITKKKYLYKSASMKVISFFGLATADPAADLRYLRELNQQITDRRRSITRSHQLEQELCNRHFETFDTYWGRPGHGAPTGVKNKLKLNELLYGVEDCTD
ncbi:uncharacterized protein LOC119676432 [Teleopsis dalmanni]|uniref:uncharacterized protein LOC119676432 n=1 Tax=Teleopsis dalmanni TaxID=139649 RepID=UPI0018CF1EBB|nr:uncharacterized protein LOC119676432 [Teleopsis dalmanni]